METQEKFYIDILRDYKEKFKSHIDIEDNYRTIFSGIFGIGKTTFLKEFFELEDIKEEYEFIHLFPVNYSIATNEDIFELIKFDIFYRLISKDIDFEITNVKLDITAYEFIKNNFTDILLPFLNFVPNVGGSIKEVAEKCIELKKKFEDFKSSSSTNELSEVENFLEDFSKKKGTIYENDFYSQLIISLIAKLKDKGKKVVLIVDDLDRIDPEHIFRLLNIFSAHTDMQGDNSNYNKFDFDKVIFVCDVDNVRNIYRAKFGIETDFNGYIDKFYSKSIFNFNISDILKSYSYKIRSKMQFIYSTRHDNINLTDASFFTGNFSFILEQLFLYNAISLRDLNRVFTNQSISFEIYELYHLGLDNYYNTSFIVTKLYDVLYYIYGHDKNKLLNSISKINFKNNHHSHLSEFLKSAILFNVLFEIGLKINQNNASDNIEIKFKGSKIVIKKEYNHKGEHLSCDIFDYDILSEDFNYFKLLYSAFKTFQTKILYLLLQYLNLIPKLRSL